MITNSIKHLLSISNIIKSRHLNCDMELELEDCGSAIGLHPIVGQ